MTRLLTLLTTWLLLTLSPPVRAETSLVLAVLPYLPAAEIERRFQPLAARLGQALGRPVVVRVGQSYQQHIAAIGRDQVDLAFIGPASYVRLVAQYGRKPLLARLEVADGDGLRGVIAVRHDSPITRLDRLKGRSMAFGALDSTTGHWLPHYQLLQAGVSLHDLNRYRHLGNHRDVALAVLAGDYDAGGLKYEIYQEYATRGLRALAVSAPVPDYLFIARSTLPPADIERARRCLLDLHRDAAGRDLLKRLQPGLKALVAADDADYDGMRRIMHAVEADRQAAGIAPLERWASPAWGGEFAGNGQ